MVSASSCLDQLITIKIQTSYFVAMKAGSQIHKEKKKRSIIIYRKFNDKNKDEG